ncbi:MAG: phosphatidylglycerophosphatase A [Endomicrobium sp.]|jgi:phosphatidylglycerophosphatase A|uniref:phosphatidylglycerophosphatase A family protein n=1 Tax=Candidatus Endomicrobiellum cubanum TaxID=3242325 RepID=UPI00281841CD|nr:phosphatidylglycerophosphatase A [Endomicrobium sp.]
MKNKIVLFLSSVFGVGYVKLAPGTFGTLAGLVIWALYAPAQYNLQLYWIISILVISIVSSSLAEQIYDVKDDKRIVIDEVAGIWFTLAFLPKTFVFLFFGFVLFRFFDIKKPWIIVKMQNLRGGLGITADDVVAGIFANFILQIINWYF